MRSPFFLALAFSLHLACGGQAGPGDGGGLAEQPLASCLPGWWTSSGTKCIVESTCDSPSTAELRTACAATDCGGTVFYGFQSLSPTQASGSYHHGWSIRSLSNRLFCVMGPVNENSWSVVDAGQVGLPSPPTAAQCFGATAQFLGVSWHRASPELQAALSSRAAQGSWGGCAY